MPLTPDVEIAIRRVAARNGIDPALMLAIAERESSFNVRSGSGSPYSSAFGLFQMLRGERVRYGGSTLDPEEQAQAWASYIKPVQAEMRSVLGRDPTGSELYLGHYFGGGRAARMIAHYDPRTPVDEIFTARERAANPNFDRAGTSGNLMASIMHDIGRREAKFGGADDAVGGTEPAAMDFARYDRSTPYTFGDGGSSAGASTTSASGGIDFSRFGTPVELGQAEQPEAAA